MKGGRKNVEEYQTNPNSLGQQEGGDYSQPYSGYAPDASQDFTQAPDDVPEASDEEFLGFSEGKPKEGLYALFNKVLTLPKSTKVGNVDKQELGQLGISVRESLRVALIGTTFNHPTFANFFAAQANIITDTSMAKKGWFTELFVTAKRFTEKSQSTQANPYAQQPQKSKFSMDSIFGKKTPEATPQ